MERQIKEKMYICKKIKMAKRNTIMKTIILFKNNNLATMLYAAKLKTDENVLRLSNFSCGYSLIGINYKTK